MKKKFDMQDMPHREIARQQREADPFIDAVLRSIPKEERESFTESQISALSRALTRTRFQSNHIVDARLNIPLFFARFYVVFLLGKDRRGKARQRLIERRRRFSLVAGLVLTLAVGLVLATVIFVAVFLLLYVLKSAMGIDLFPDMHLRDLFP